jgi:hypothetical protein
MDNREGDEMENRECFALLNDMVIFFSSLWNSSSFPAQSEIKGEIAHL